MASHKDLYGTGFQHPVQFSPAHGGVTQVTAEASVAASLRRLFNTSPGEDRFNPRYGCGLKAFLFENDVVTLRALVDTVVREAIKKFEPRVQSILSLTVTSDPAQPGLLTVALTVLLLQSATPTNFVFPFTTQE